MYCSEKIEPRKSRGRAPRIKKPPKGARVAPRRRKKAATIGKKAPRRSTRKKKTESTVPQKKTAPRADEQSGAEKSLESPPIVRRRRSGRLRGQPEVDYTDAKIEAWLDDKIDNPRD